MDDLFTTQSKTAGPVECFGQTFASDEARREHFLTMLAEKLKDPEFRKIEGFPIGTDEAILALSDPPYYTACPNPFIANFIKFYGKPYDPNVLYSKEPFAADVSEGKNDPLYNAHTYHTKVPHKAIMRYILHYTQPGDVVFDGFCGTGMTGVAAQLCGDHSVVSELGYKVGTDGTIMSADQENGRQIWKPFSKVGPRIPVLNDLAPIATFISNNYGALENISDFYVEAIDAIEDLEKKIGWVYQNQGARVANGIWSDVFYCPICTSEIVFWDAAVKDDEISKTFSCPSCNGMVGKASSKDDGALKLERAYETKYDWYLGENIKSPKLLLVEEKVKRGTTTSSIKVDRTTTSDIFSKIDAMSPIKSVPVLKFEEGRQTNKLINGSGIQYVHWMYTPRALFVYGRLWEIELSCYQHTSFFRFCLTGINNYISRKQGYFGGGGGVAGTLFTPSIHLERNIFDVLRRKLKSVSRIVERSSNVRSIGNQSSASLGNIPTNSVDYVFIDPPFGENFQYAELNSFAEAWLKVRTFTASDCVMNYVHKKDLNFYLQLMKGTFLEFYRILKPGRWITIEFSNTQASVWNAIQIGLQEAGFVVANVSALDKIQGSFNAVTNAMSVKQDLVISAYKPNGGLEGRFTKAGGSEDSAWDFVRTHLKYLPTVKVKNSVLEFIAERDPRIIFDRMVAWFIRHNFPVPMSTQAFQAGLKQRFPDRDGMVFLAEQVTEYDKKRMQVASAPQMEMFVSDERSAIDWLADFLKKRPSTYSEIHPEYIPVIGTAKKKGEIIPELTALLEDNFLQYEGMGEVPSQIHSYLSTNFKDLRGLEKSDASLIGKATDRWYVPDHNKAQDLEKKREKALLKEFATYQSSTSRKLKEFRLEVLRAGFNSAWANKDYKAIIAIAEKIPEDALQEDEKLLTLYDLALTRMESGA